MVIDFGGYYARKPELKDLENIYSYRNDPSVFATLGGFFSGVSRSAVQKWIERNSANHDDYVWVIAQEGSDECVGHCGLYKTDFRIGKAELGAAIAREHWGNGLGGRVLANVTAYGFEQLRLNRVETFNLEINRKVVRIKEQLGYQVEGILREYQFRDGNYLDVMVMAVIGSDWQGVPAKYAAGQAS